MYAYMYLCVYYIIVIYRHLTFTYLLVMNDGDEDQPLRNEENRKATIKRIMEKIGQKVQMQELKPTFKKKKK